VEGEPISFTARHEQRQRGDNYWYAYRRVEGKLHNVYMGLSSQLTRQRLRETSEKLHNKVLTSLVQDSQRQHPELPPPARLKIGDLAAIRPGYEAAWTDKRHKRRFADGEMVVVIQGPSLDGGTIAYTIRKLVKPKNTAEMLGTQLVAVAETIKQELAEPLDPELLEPEIRARLENIKPDDRGALAQAAYYLLRSGGAANLEKMTIEGSRSSYDLVFPRRYGVSSLLFDGFLAHVPEAEGASRQRLTPFGVLALRWLRTTWPAQYADAGLYPPPRKVLKVAMWLHVERNSSFVRGKKKVVDWIENYILRPYDMEKAPNGDYHLSISYVDEEEIDGIIEEIFQEAHEEADMYYCFIDDEGAKALDGSDRYW
jgi:hypothetical protein